jgi:hypothetical protein
VSHRLAPVWGAGLLFATVAATTAVTVTAVTDAGSSHGHVVATLPAAPAVGGPQSLSAPSNGPLAPPRAAPFHLPAPVGVIARQGGTSPGAAPVNAAAAGGVAAYTAGLLAATGHPAADDLAVVGAHAVSAVAVSPVAVSPVAGSPVTPFSLRSLTSASPLAVLQGDASPPGQGRVPAAVHTDAAPSADRSLQVRPARPARPVHPTQPATPVARGRD